MPITLMVRMHERDDMSQLVLMDGYLPDKTVIQSAAPRNPKHLRLEKPNYESRDKAAAEIFNSLAQRMAYFRRGEYPGIAHKLPLATWIVAPPKQDNAALADWFKNEPDDTDYRMMLHWMPSTNNGHDLQELWTRVHNARHIPVSHRSAPYHQLKKNTQPLLKELLQTYRHGQYDAVNQYMSQIGHPTSSAFSHLGNTMK